MATKLNLGNGNSLLLKDKTGKTYDEAFDALNRALMAIQPFGSPREMLLAVVVELLHWMYAEEGTHEEPADMLKEALEQLAADQGTRPVVPQGKTND